MARRFRTHHKLLIAFVLTLLPLMAMALLSARRQWQQRREAIYVSHQEMAEAVGQVLEAFFQSFADTQQAMAIAAETGVDSPEAFRTFIQRVDEAKEHLLGFAVIAADGTVTHSDRPDNWWRSLPDRSDIRAVRSGKHWAVSSLQHAVDGAPVVTITSCPLGSNGQLLRSVIDVRALEDPLRLKLRPGWRVLIVDRQGRLIYHSLHPDRKWEDRDWQRDSGAQAAFRHGVSRREGYRSPVDGRICLASYVFQPDIEWVVGSACPVDLVMGPVRAAAVADCAQTVLAFAASLLLIGVFGRRISRPIERLAADAAAFGRGESPTFVVEDRGDEVGVLARALETMARQVKARFDREHTIASTLQRAFLPERLPELPGFAIHATYHPALKEADVGGDFYDVFSLPCGRVGFLLGDVSGKGLEAATYATMTRYMARAYAAETPSPAEAVQRLNQALCGAIDDEYVFVTAFYGVLEPEPGLLSYVNAGHWPPLLDRRGETEVVGGHGTALGVSPEAIYTQGHLHLAPGDTLLLFTDGLVETGSDDPMDHLELMQKMLARRRDDPLPHLLSRLHREALRHGGGAARDDVALLALRRSAPVSGLQAPGSRCRAPNLETGDWHLEPGAAP
jgi:serine phosphatase RsbU (regulator of sigma subunit)